MIFISKEKFLEEHNKLSPMNLQATLTLLNRFKEEKRPPLSHEKRSILLGAYDAGIFCECE